MMIEIQCQTSICQSQPITTNTETAVRAQEVKGEKTRRRLNRLKRGKNDIKWTLNDNRPQGHLCPKNIARKQSRPNITILNTLFNQGGLCGLSSQDNQGGQVGYGGEGGQDGLGGLGGEGDHSDGEGGQCDQDGQKNSL